MYIVHHSQINILLLTSSWIQWPGWSSTLKDKRGPQAQRRASSGQEGGNHQELVQRGGNCKEVNLQLKLNIRFYIFLLIKLDKRDGLLLFVFYSIINATESNLRIWPVTCNIFNCPVRGSTISNKSPITLKNHCSYTTFWVLLLKQSRQGHWWPN